MIPFNIPSITDIERIYISESLKSGKLCGDGAFTKKASAALTARLGLSSVLLTTSCSHALDMSAMLLELKEGDEVILPSYTFVSTANAFVLRGAKPVFAEIDGDTLNLDADLIEPLITKSTKAVFTVHYAGGCCDMDKLSALCTAYNLSLVEDAAQAVGSVYKGRPLGGFGELAAFSFHETKNYVMGEGGALVVNNKNHLAKAEIIREKGTDRSLFLRGEVDKYTWRDVGSSYLPSDVLAAILYGQLERFDEIMRKRMKTWDFYHQLLEPYEKQGILKRHKVREGCEHNAHMYYFLLPTPQKRDFVLAELKARGILAIFHYIPLHQSDMGKKFGYSYGDLPVTESCAERLVRLPLFVDLTEEQLLHIERALQETLAL